MSTPKMTIGQLMALAEAEPTKPAWSHPSKKKSWIGQNLALVKSLRDRNFTWKQVTEWLNAKGITHSPTGLNTMYNQWIKEERDGTDETPATTKTTAVKGGKAKTKVTAPVEEEEAAAA